MVAKPDSWNQVNPNDAKLGMALRRILVLKEAGLTIEKVGADFLRHRITPLQHRKGRQAWDYQGSADPMRLRQGLGDNLMTMGHYLLICRIFNKGCNVDLPAKVIPLCNNTAKASILAQMPDCDTWMVLNTWKEPSQKDVDNWFASLVEEAIGTEDGMMHPTKDDREEFLAARADESKKTKVTRPRPGKDQSKKRAAAPEASGGSRSQEHAEEHVGEEEQAEEPEGGEEEKEQPEGSLGEEELEEEEEPPCPPPAKMIVAKKTVRKGEAHTESTSQGLAGVKVAAAIPRAQPSRQLPSRVGVPH
jgi:hypothetical protein